jgi:hypothetical protein
VSSRTLANPGSFCATCVPGSLTVRRNLARLIGPDSSRIALCSRLGFGLGLARAKEKHIMAHKRKETKKERRAAAKRK